MFDASIQSPNGLTPTNLDVRVTARGGAVVKRRGVKFDLTARFHGVVDALGGDTSTIGVALTVNADGELEATTAETDVVLGLALETLANATLGSVLFNGAGYGNV